MPKKLNPLNIAIALITAFTFLWNQCIWAIGSETLYNQPSDNPQRHVETNNPKYEENLPQDLQKTSQKVFCRFIEELAKKAHFEAELTSVGAKNPIQTCVTSGGNDRLGRIDEKYGTYDGKKYKWQAISYDELGRPTAYKEKYGKVSSRHYDIQYNELGDVAYEKVKVTVKSGGLIKSKTKILTEYWYGYDEYGQREKIKEHEIYRKTSTSGFGRFFSILTKIVQIVTFFVPGLQMLAFTLNMVNAALTGNVAGFVGAILGQVLGGAISGLVQGGTGAGAVELFAAMGIGSGQGLSNIALVFKVFDLIGDLAGAISGDNRISNIFGKATGILQGLLGIIGGFGGGGPPNLLSILFTLGKIGLNFVSDQILRKLGPFAGSFINSFVNSIFDILIQTAPQITLPEKGLTPEQLQAQGYQQLSNGDWVKWEGNKLIRVDSSGKTYADVFDGQGNYSYTELFITNNLTAITDIFGNVSYFTLTTPQGIMFLDPSGIPVFTQYSDGRILSYDIFGNPEGWLAPNALPRWDNQGQLIGSFTESDLGTTYYDRNAEYAGFTPKGYTAVQVDDQIAYSYQKISDDSFYMVDSDGQNNRYIRQQLDGMNIPIGEYIASDTTTAYYDSRGIKLWDRENQPNSVINLYLEDGTPWANITTLVSQSGLTEGYRFTDLATGDFRKYDSNGELQAYYLARKDAQGNIYGYKGVDTQGTQITLDRNGNIHSTLTKKGEYSVYKNGELYRVIRRESVAILDGRVLDRDPTGLYSLYDYSGNKITDNPIAVVIKLNFSLLSLPQVIAQEIIDNAQFAFQILMGQLALANDKSSIGPLPPLSQRIVTSIRHFFNRRTMDLSQAGEIGLTVGFGGKVGIEAGPIKGEAGYFAGQEYTFGGEEVFKGETIAKRGISLEFWGGGFKVGPEDGVKMENTGLIPFTGEITPYGELGLGTEKLDIFSIEKQPRAPITPEFKIGTSIHVPITKVGFGFGTKWYINPSEFFDYIAGWFGFDPSGDDYSNLIKYYEDRGR